MTIQTVNTLLIILVILLVYWRMRNLYYNSLALEYQYKLYRLRDKVRLYAIDKKIKHHDIFFDYMDKSICVTVKELPNFNLLGIFFLYSKHKNEEKAGSFKKMIDGSIKNEFAKEVFEEYGKIISMYMSKRHYIIKFTLISLLRIFQGYRGMKKSVSITTDAIQSIRFYPETSAAYTIIK